MKHLTLRFIHLSCIIFLLVLFMATTASYAEGPTDHHHPAVVHDQGIPAAGHDHTAPISADVHAPPAETHDHHASGAVPTHDPSAATTAAHGDHGGHGTGEAHQHPGLPMVYVWGSVVTMAGILLWGLWAGAPDDRPKRTINLSQAPGVGRAVRWFYHAPWPLVTLKIISVTVFLIVVYAGLFGSPLPERNLATNFVWNLWWPLVVVSVFFMGSFWCGICPWDTLASWLVRHRLWRRTNPHPGLNLKVPQALRNVWPALLMFMGLTWLELGIGVTKIPMATALMALIMVFLALVSLVIFERKAFCRYFCPVGRALGFYSRLAPIGVRSQNQEICTQCKSMECYNGSEEIEPCPTHLTIGRFSQNTYCLSCGNCALSCPHKNVSWQLRSPGSEALAEARPMWDGAWFMLALMGITSFHGVTMMPFWNTWLDTSAHWFGETEMPIAGFTLGMLAGFLLPVLVYALAIGATQMLLPGAIGYRRLFVALPFSTLPLAFAYHLSHNLDHLYRETGGLWDVLANPLGTGLVAMTAAERQLRLVGGGMSEQVLFLSQAGLMTLGLWLAVEILRHRGWGLQVGGVRLTGWRLAPMLVFIAAMTACNLWLMAQNMNMRF
ncbi:MAG: 4Fe-4S binding protein [Magnetococcus sp. THC-1_WYH]